MLISTEREVVQLVKSSANSWASDDVNVMPDYKCIHEMDSLLVSIAMSIL